MTQEVVLSKSDYAKHAGFSPGRLSQLIAEGVISGDALVGQGRAARIRVAVADEQRRRRMHQGQLLGQGRAAVLMPAASAAPAAMPPMRAAEDDYQARYLKAKAEGEEIATGRARRKEKAERGEYMVTAAAQEAWSKEIAGLLQQVDIWWPDLAAGLVAAGQMDQKAMTGFLRERWRLFRAHAADGYRQAVEAEPELVDDEGDEC